MYIDTTRNISFPIHERKLMENKKSVIFIYKRTRSNEQPEVRKEKI